MTDPGETPIWTKDRHPEDELGDRDPLYDHDHSEAHGVPVLLERFRTLSTSHLLDFAPTRAHTLITQETTDSADTGTMSKESSVLLPEPERHRRLRRSSHDDLRPLDTRQHRQFYINVPGLKERILQQEDTDGDYQITASDSGPKMMTVGTLASQGHRRRDVRGTYALANLLQELALASDHGRKRIVLDESRLHENPVDRLSRMIRHHFWDGLTRRIDADGLESICNDPKNRSTNHQPRIYVPFDDDEALEYYRKVARDKPHLSLDVVQLPKDITPDYVKSINDRPGILSLALKKAKDTNGSDCIRGVPFVVPGGRFNEQYGWDSYFEALGLLEDGRVTLSKSMVDNFVYEIRHYGKILNANRSYYLTRSQPPFLTDMILQVYRRLPDKQPGWLRESFCAAIKEYYSVWMSPPRFVSDVGLSRFHGEGIGMPPETESSHFDAVLLPYAEKHGLSISEFSKKYNDREIKEPDLDLYFIHDRAVRESGHDTTYRLEGKCAFICPVDLNCLLYKYEMDIGATIRDFFDDALQTWDGIVETSVSWFERAKKRKELINKYFWNEEKGLYYDFDIHLMEQSPYESVTSLFALWAGVSSADQASKLIKTALEKFEMQGGLVSGTKESRGEISLSRPNRQWDYPYGWAPHQIIAWQGLYMYGHEDVARRLAYRWLYTIVKAFVNFNGVVPEKFDVVSMNHKVHVEYGNVGTDFKLIPREGFGWMNSSFKVGLTYLNSSMRRALGALVHPNQYFYPNRKPN